MRVLQTREIERMEQKLSAAMGAQPHDVAAAIEALEEAVKLARTDARAAEWFVPSELLGEPGLVAPPVIGEDETPPKQKKPPAE